jgi:hypothetical protein
MRLAPINVFSPPEPQARHTDLRVPGGRTCRDLQTGSVTSEHRVVSGSIEIESAIFHVSADPGFSPVFPPRVRADRERRERLSPSSLSSADANDLRGYVLGVLMYCAAGLYVPSSNIYNFF